MAANTKNKYPADKAGTKYSEFKNTKRTPPGKSRTEQGSRHTGSGADQTAGKT
ncbi:MAG TPA: hypothetical protein VEC01_13160 [Noviherbaspirillum sp.]|uniref:hypothetical protein n=1 Tax=Noviherbaspirillum sp. TaxID=1926288 RepID=UPI002D717873|nr:hypothetical protein [Noviherbaspirillum sp.]HYD96271.1 hypothetical protein [Noviherbaspirillum sp.]